MCPYNNLSSSLGTGDYNQIINRINAIKAALPFLINLTPDERRRGLRQGDKSMAFVSKALEYASAHPNLVPPYLNVGEFQKDGLTEQTIKKTEKSMDETESFVKRGEAFAKITESLG